MMRRPANRYRDGARTAGVNFGKNKKFTFVLLLVAVVYVYINSVFTVVEDIEEHATANTMGTNTGEINDTHNINNSHEYSNGGTDHDNSFDVNNGVDDMSPFEHGTETAQTEYESDNTQEGDEVLNEEKDPDQTEETATEDEETTGNQQEEQEEESTTDKATDEAVSEESTEAVDGETTEAADGETTEAADSGSTENKIDEVDTNEGEESKIEAVSSEVGACESNPFAAALDKSFDELIQMLSSTEVETAEEDVNDHVVEKEEIEATEQDKDDLNVEDTKEDEDAKFFSSVTSSTETTDQDEVVANVEDEDAKFFSSGNSSTETVKQEDNESTTLFSSGNDSTVLRETDEESVRRNLRGRNKSAEKEDKEDSQEKEDDEEAQENEGEEEAQEEEPKETSDREEGDESKEKNDGEEGEESLEITDEEQDQESKETTDGEEEESKETSDPADSISVKCATESKYSALPGICGLENHMKGEENDGHCNYVIAYSGLDSNKHFTLLQETNCNIFVTQLCSEDEPIAFNKEEEYERLTFLDNMCLKPSMAPTKEDEVDAVIRRLESATTDSFDLTEIDLLYIELPKDESSSQEGLFESYVDTTRFYFMSMGEDSTIVKSVNLPMQMVLNNVKEVAQVRENLQTKAMANGLIIIDGAETDNEKESSSLTLMRFTCPPPKEAPMGGSAHFVGAGFPV